MSRTTSTYSLVSFFRIHISSSFANGNTVAFEIIGMLGKVLRIRGSSFRMLPNPTSDPMIKQVGRKPAWKIARLMEVFQEKVEELSDGS
jgi:hypothetical protein